MSERNPLDLGTPRFFRAMVLMGSTLALGCAGSSLDTTDGEAGGAGGTHGNKVGQGGAGGTDSATGGSDSSTGGSEPSGSGGTEPSGTGGTGGSGGTTGSVTGGTGSAVGGGPAAGTGGTDGTATGGSTAAGGTGTSGTGGVAGGSGTGGTVCSPEQWSCTAFLSCGVGDIDGYVLPENCTCDPGRPLSGTECESGRRACLEATQTADGTPLERSIPFQCECAPYPTSCTESCHAVFPDGDGHRCSDVGARLAPEEPKMAPDDILCGCSFVYLK